MKILPIPKTIIHNEGVFRLNGDTAIKANSFKVADTILFLRDAIQESCDISLRVVASKTDNVIEFKLLSGDAASQGYTLEVADGKAVISAESECGLYYGAVTLCQIIDEYGFSLPFVKIEDCPDIEKRGVLFDVTRGRVPTLENMKTIIRMFSFYKMNQLYLYTEHAFEYSKISEAWRGSSALSAADILELREYAKRYYVELVPCFASLGHLYHVFSSKSYSHLCETEIKPQYSWIDRQVHYVADVSNPESEKLIKSMLDETMPLFDSPYFNLCCDETFDLGTGKSKKMAEEKGVKELYCEFVLKLCDYVNKNGKKPMVFADILLDDEYEGDIKPEWFKDCVLVTWAYDGEGREHNVEKVAKMGMEQYTCCGTNGWNRFINDFGLAKDNILTVSKHAKKYGVTGFINTDWGDMGHINWPETSNIMFMYGAAYSWNACPSVEDNDICRIASEKEYGSDDMMELLKELSSCELFNWADINSFHETLRGNIFTEADKIATWVDEDFANKRGLDELKAAYDNALKLSRIFEDKAAACSDKVKKSKYKFVILAAEAIALGDAYLAAVKKDRFGQCEEYIINPLKLAEKFEYWLDSYEKLWNNGYRESELWRIKQLVYSVCDDLRDYEHKNSGK